MSSGECGDFVDGEWCDLLDRYDEKVREIVLEHLDEHVQASWQEQERALERLHGLFGSYR